MDCKNCQVLIADDASYCQNCGGKVIKNRLTIKNLLAHFSEAYLNYDNKLLQTFINLFKKPEDVIGSYINGTRKKYTDVISYFAIALTLSGLQMFILNKYFPEALDISNMATEKTEEFQRRNFQFIQEYQSLIMMFYVPIYALISRIVFFNIKKYNYTEHLVIFMYILAQASILSALISVISAVFGYTIGNVGAYFTIPFQLLYSAYCLKRLVKLSILGIILRTLLFLVVLSILMMLFGMVMALIMIANGGIENLIQP